MKGGVKNMASITNIKKSLITQLKNNGANVDHFIGLVEDYIWFCKQEKEMQSDIKEHGHLFETLSSSGNPIVKENPSIKNAKMYNDQKLKILKQLGLEAKNIVDDPDDEL